MGGGGGGDGGGGGGGGGGGDDGAEVVVGDFGGGDDYCGGSGGGGPAKRLITTPPGAFTRLTWRRLEVCQERASDRFFIKKPSRSTRSWHPATQPLPVTLQLGFSSRGS